MQLTPRQQRRLQQKLARKAEKRARKAEATRTIPEASEPANAQSPNLVSDAKLAANRANAQLSTGAITEAGKAIVAQNASKHGLTGKFQVLEGESQDDFDQLLAAFLQNEQPANQEEIEMVRGMAEATWLSRRSIRLQDRCIVAIESGTPAEQRQAERQLALYLRYMTTHDRAFTRYSTELRKRRNERARAERGFVSQKLKEAAEQRRSDLNQARQALQNAKKEGQEIRNRLATAKAEAVERKNLARKTEFASQNPERTLIAAA